MIRNRRVATAMHLIVSLTWIIGCDQRVVEVSREAADRQAAQNRQMGELQKEVARGSRSLVEADAAARQQIVGVHRDLQAERGQLNTGFEALEIERQQVAKQRQSESLLHAFGSAIECDWRIDARHGLDWLSVAIVGERSNERLDRR